MLHQKWLIVSWVQLIVSHSLSAAQPTPLPFPKASTANSESDDTEWIMEEFVPHLWKAYNRTADARRNSSVEDTTANSYEDVNSRIGLAPSTSHASNNIRPDQGRWSSTRSDERPYICSNPGCGMAFKTKGNLKTHVMRHSDERPYNCSNPGCRKAFKQKGHLREHVLIHADERPRPYVCTQPECGKAFQLKSHLKVHGLTHINDRPYKCNYHGCKKAFKLKSNLKQHSRTHYGEKPYECTVTGCEQRFTRKQAMLNRYTQARGHMCAAITDVKGHLHNRYIWTTMSNRCTEARGRTCAFITDVIRHLNSN